MTLKNLLLVTLSNTLSLIATLTAGYPESKSSLSSTVTPIQSSNFSSLMSSPQSLLQVIVDLCKAGEAAKENRGLFRLVTVYP